jgi:F-type H+-transporting ATPase subunit a
MKIKKRYVILACVVLLIVFGILPATRPVLPFIQLPGEVYPATSGIFGQSMISPPGITNTFIATLLAFIIVVAMGIGLRARSRTPDEVPTGFYNFFEMIIEAAYNFAVNLGGTRKAKDFFPLFFTIIIYILVANWMELIPGVDSIGFAEYLPHAEAIKEVDKLEKAGEISFASESEREAYIHDLEHQLEMALDPLDASPDEGYRNGVFITKAGDREAFGWNLVPFIRAAATDLNFTVALSLVTMFMVQFYGFSYLGARGYLSKFFPFIQKGWGAQVGKSPIKSIDPAVGLLELVGEISRIISFAFRLLGNIFAGQILLFVIGFLVPVFNIVFFGLEFFVGLIQALVFGLLGLIFMVGASESHHGDEHHEEHAPVEAVASAGD